MIGLLQSGMTAVDAVFMQTTKKGQEWKWNLISDMT
jgi:hypothetical protein